MVLYIFFFVFSGNAWGQKEQSIVDLLNRLRNSKSNSAVQVEILNAIAKMGEEAKPAIPDLIEILRGKTKNKEVREAAGSALQHLGPSSIPALIEVIDDVDKVDTLGRILACRTLGELDKDAKAAIPKLVDVLSNKQNDIGLRASAAGAIGEIGIGTEEAVKALIEALDDIKEVRLRREAAFALGQLRTKAKLAVPKLIAILKDRNEDSLLRGNAAGALGLIGIPRKDFIHLTEIINNDPDSYVRSVAADSLKSLEASSNLEASSDFKAASRWTSFVIFLEEHPIYSILGGAYLLIAISVLALFLFAPLWLLRANESLMSISDITLPWVGGIRLPVRYLFLLGFFHYHPRVLDAWVNHHIGEARKAFDKTLVEKKQDVYVPISVDFNDGDIPSRPDAAKLQSIFEREISHLLISGDGGIGKTNLACQLGKWAMSDVSGHRLCPTHPMLPILLEDFKGEEPSSEASLISKIQNSVRFLIRRTDKPSSGLVQHLLKHRRLLLIVDSLSEMDSGARTDIISGIRDVPVNALIITSRTKKELGDLQPKTIAPQKLSRSNLNVFVESYLQYKGKLDLFKGTEEFQDACFRLTSIDGKNEVPILLAKLFVDKLIDNKESSSAWGAIEKLPQTIPDLMVDSIEILNRHETKDSFDTKVVIVTAKALAWRSLEETLTPSSLSYEAALDVLRSEEVAAELFALGIPDSYLDETKRSLLIKHLEDISIIKVINHYPQRIRFRIDALSEYLASLYLINKYGRNLRDWNRFLSRASKLKGKGFILALRDCCQSKGAEFKTPDSVADKLSELLKKIEAE